MMAVLWFHCTFEVVVGGGEHSIYPLHHPDWKPRILKLLLIHFHWFLPLIRLPDGNPLCSPEACATAKFVISVWPKDPILLFWEHSIYWSLLSLYSRTNTRSHLQIRGRCRFSTWMLRVPVSPVGGPLGKMITKACLWTSCWSTEPNQPNHVSLMPFNIICFFPDLLPPTSHGCPTSVLWVLLERNGLSSNVLHSWESQTLTILPFFHQRGHRPSSTPCNMGLGKRWQWQSSFCLQWVQTCIFLFSSDVRNSPSLRLNFYKVSLICGFVPKSALSRFPWPWPRDVGKDSLASAGFATLTKVFCLLLPLIPLGICCRVPQLQLRTFCL